LEQFVASGPTPDLTWLFKADAWLLARTAAVPMGPARPTVCDLDDLDDVRLRSVAALHRQRVARPPELAGVSGAVLRAAGRADAARWAAFRRRVGATATTVVCSELERRRSRLAGALVIPNGHPGPAAVGPARAAVGPAAVGPSPAAVGPGLVGPSPAAVEPPPVKPSAVGPAAVGPSPAAVGPGLVGPAWRPAPAPVTAVLVGSFHYLPNLDAARWTAAAIAPALRRLDPRATVRLVGDGPAEMTRLAGLPGVVWTGPVADAGLDLQAASAAVVPLRAGSGTRVKIVEAWAHGVPVVTTAIGAEGLDARDGEHLLVADDADAIAGAVIRLSTDDGLRRRLVDAGRRRWRAAHSPDAVAGAVASVLNGALQSAVRR
jgi:glycosyltransferase involved in cell wall biosynthesis